MYSILEILDDQECKMADCVKEDAETAETRGCRVIRLRDILSHLTIVSAFSWYPCLNKKFCLVTM